MFNDIIYDIYQNMLRTITNILRLNLTLNLTIIHTRVH